MKVDDKVFMFWFGKVRKFKIISMGDEYIDIFRRICPLRSEKMRVPSWMVSSDIYSANGQKNKVLKYVHRVTIL
jgi:hypothetical protein